MRFCSFEILEVVSYTEVRYTHQMKLSEFVPINLTTFSDFANPFWTQAAQAHYMNADVTLACERCCVTNGIYKGLYGM